MHVLHLVHQYLPEAVGGTELYTQWLSQALQGRGHQNTIFYRRSAAGSGLTRREEGGIQVYAAWSGPVGPRRRVLATFGDRALTEAFERVLDETQPTLVHVQHLMGLPVQLIRLLQRRNIPYLVTLWDFWWQCANAQLLTNYDQTVCDGPATLYLNCARCALARLDKGNLWPLLPILALPLGQRNRYLKQIIDRAALVIAPTDFVRRWHVAHGFPTERLLTVSPGIETPALSPTRTQRARPVRLAYIGGLSRQKGVHILLQAFQGLDGQAELWIAGDETADPTYVAELRALESPGVRFLGRLSRPAVWETLAQVDVVAVPTLWYETFSFIVSEAFAAGAPVVASRIGPLAERVRHEVDGLLAPPGDVTAWRQALERVIQDSTLRARLQAGIAPVFSLEDHVQAIERLYRQALEGA